MIPCTKGPVAEQVKDEIQYNIYISHILFARPGDREVGRCEGKNGGLVMSKCNKSVVLRSTSK